MGGLSARVPLWATVMGFFVLASAGLPGLSGFVGEFLSMLGTFVVNPLAAVVAAFAMILGAAYLLFMFQRVAFGEVSDFLEGLGGHLTDMTPIEILTLVPLGTLIVVFGVQPGLLLTLVQGSVEGVLTAADGGQAIPIGTEVVVIALALIIVLVLARTIAATLGRRRETGVAAVEGGAAS
jgi:NADH-quinone oxidoreductase subunit M